MNTDQVNFIQGKQIEILEMILIQLRMIQKRIL